MILARHGESTASARGVLNGDPAAGVGLTERGEEQARQLGRELTGVDLDLGVHTALPRTADTLELALTGRNVPVVEEPRLSDPRAGAFEGKTLDDYRAWAWNRGSGEDAPGGGESRLAVVDRYRAAYNDLLERSEQTILAVVHGVTIAYMLLARDGEPPRPRMDIPVEYAHAYPFTSTELERALAVLEGWCADPTW